MNKQFQKYKGIHPGIILDRELRKRSIKKRPFALSLSEHPQTFNAITKGKRSLNTSLALKIEKELNLEEGTLVFLQAWLYNSFVLLPPIYVVNVRIPKQCLSKP